MWFLLLISVIFILLIILTITSTFIGIVLKIVTRHTYDQVMLIIPSLLSNIIWGLIILFYYLTLKSVFNINLMEHIANSIIYPTNQLDIITPFILLFSFFIIGIILNSFALLTLNLFNKDDLLKLGNEELNKSNENNSDDKQDLDIITTNNPENLVETKTFKLSYINALVSSLFLFSLIFFFSLLLFSIGTIISNKII